MTQDLQLAEMQKDQNCPNIDEEDNNSDAIITAAVLPEIPAEKTIDVNQEKSSAAENEPSKRVHRWWYPLPLILVIMATIRSEPILMNDLIVKRYRYELCNSTELSSLSSINCTVANGTDADIIVQQRAAQLNTILGAVAVGPAIVVFTILGANGDRIGRRPLMIFPFFGKVIRYSLLIPIVKDTWSDGWLIAINILDTTFGSFMLVQLGATVYMTDCTTVKTRSFAFLVKEVGTSVTRILTLLGLGFWLRSNGYVLPVSIILGLNIAALIYAIFFQPDSKVHKPFWQQLRQIRLTPVLDTYRVFLVKRQGHQQQLIILLTLVQFFMLLMLLGYLPIHPLYLYGPPFYLNALNVAILQSSQFGLMIILSLLLSIRRKYLDAPPLPIIGIAIYIVHLSLFGSARIMPLLYVAELLGSSFFIIMPILRSRVTKLITKEEFAVIFVAIGVIEVLGTYMSGSISNAIYKVTVTSNPSTIFYILSGLGAFPLTILCYIFGLDWFDKRRQMKIVNPDTDEKHNDNTVSK